MAIKKIKISNFKSFKDLEIDLGKFNVLIGANASGKSNFIQIFKFLRDLSEFGLENAISMQGGTEYFRNLNIGSSKNFSIEFSSDRRKQYMVEKEKLTVEGYENIYEFSLKFVGTSRFEIVEEKFVEKCNFYRLLEKKKASKEKLGEGEIIVHRRENRWSVDLQPPKGVDIDHDDIFEISITENLLTSSKVTPKSLLIDMPCFFPIVWYSLENLISNISTYDLDPRLSKKAQAITGRTELLEDGSNLSIVLKSIMRSGNNRRKLFNLLQENLPFVDNLILETFADKSLIFKLRESYSGRKFLPSFLISDGTINFIALIIVLYFQDKALKIIEEPERNIHPYLISRVVKMMKEASKNNQVIITTHNPEIVRHADIEDILLVSRDRDGFSRISKPAEKSEVRVFLEHEMGIDELYVQNLLEM